MGVTAAVAAVVSVGVQVKSAQDQKAAQEKQLRAQEKARTATQAQRNQQAAAQRRQQVREERIRRGKILQAAETTGATAASGAIQSVGAGATQTQANLGFAGSQANLGNFISQQNQQAANFAGDVQSAATLGKLSGNIFSAGGGFGTIETGFNKVFK